VKITTTYHAAPNDDSIEGFRIICHFNADGLPDRIINVSKASGEIMVSHESATDCFFTASFCAKVLKEKEYALTKELVDLMACEKIDPNVKAKFAAHEAMRQLIILLFRCLIDQESGGEGYRWDEIAAIPKRKTRKGASKKERAASSGGAPSGEVAASGHEAGGGSGGVKATGRVASPSKGVEASGRDAGGDGDSSGGVEASGSVAVAKKKGKGKGKIAKKESQANIDASEYTPKK
jgi:hypothetical protein